MSRAACCCAYAESQEFGFDFQEVARLLGLLPHLQSLLLGQNRMTDLILLQPFILGPTRYLCVEHGNTEIKAQISLRKTLADYAFVVGRIRHLDVPSRWALQPCARKQLPVSRNPGIDWNITAFTSLQRLTVPCEALFSVSREEEDMHLFGALPASLKCLTMIMKRYFTLHTLLCKLDSHLLDSTLPQLSNIEVWSHECDPNSLLAYKSEDAGAVSDMCSKFATRGTRIDVQYDFDVWETIMQEAGRELGFALETHEYFGLQHRGYFERWKPGVVQRHTEATLERDRETAQRAAERAAAGEESEEDSDDDFVCGLY